MSFYVNFGPIILSTLLNDEEFSSYLTWYWIYVASYWLPSTWSSTIP